jgi:hypothetical protein
MDVEEYKRLLDLATNPPPGSEIEAAKRAGVNLRFTAYLLMLTPTQRVRKMERRIRFAQEGKLFMRGKRTRPRYAPANVQR